MQIQSTAYTQSVKNQYSASAHYTSASTTALRSGDKISISPEAEKMVQKMNSEKSGEDLPLEEYRIPEWYEGYGVPCCHVELKIGEKMDMEKEEFAQRHRFEIAEYQQMTQEAYSAVCKKYNIEKYSDYEGHSMPDIEEDFRNLLAENPRANELMEILKVEKRL